MFPWRPQLTHLWITCTGFLITVDRWSRGESEWSAMLVDLKCERSALVAYTHVPYPDVPHCRDNCWHWVERTQTKQRNCHLCTCTVYAPHRQLRAFSACSCPKRTLLWVHMYYTLNNQSTTPPWQNGRRSKGTHPPCYEISNFQLTWAMSRIGTTTHTSPAIWLDRGKTKSHACERNLLQRNYYMFVGSCLASKSLNLNTTQWKVWRW